MFNLTLRENIAFSTDVTDEDLEKAIATAELRDFIARCRRASTPWSPSAEPAFPAARSSASCWPARWRSIPGCCCSTISPRASIPPPSARFSERPRTYPGITLLSVTQKIASVEDYDQIMLLMEGEVLATGTHAQLMETSPEYVQIYDSQRSTNHYEVQA